MRDITTVAVVVKNIKVNNSKQTNGTVEFHRLNSKKIIIKSLKIALKTYCGDCIAVYI
jgi:hypothetical protein